jgi:hypothetical protein
MPSQVLTNNQINDLENHLKSSNYYNLHTSKRK